MFDLNIVARRPNGLRPNRIPVFATEPFSPSGLIVSAIVMGVVSGVFATLFVTDMGEMIRARVSP